MNKLYSDKQHLGNRYFLDKKPPVRKGESLKTRKKKAIKAARELLYGDDVVNQINNATTENEIDRILATARERRSNV